MGATPSGISGSRSAAVLGLSEFVSRFEVWQQIKEERDPGFNAKRGYTMPIFEGNAATRWGLAFEDSVIRLAEQARGLPIINRENQFFQQITPSDIGAFCLSCHIDGAFDPSGKDEPEGFILHNGKITNSISFRNKWGEPGTAAVPQSYAIQAQHDMLVSGAEQTILSVLVFPEMPDRFEENLGLKVLHDETRKEWFIFKSGEGYISPLYWAEMLKDMGFFHQYTIPRDEAAQAVMLEQYRAFWTDHIIGDAEPAPETPEDIARAFPAPVGTIICTDQMAAWIAERKAITEEIGGKGPLSKRKDELKVLILDAARKMDATVDDDSREKTILMSPEGRKLGSWDGKTFR